MCRALAPGGGETEISHSSFFCTVGLWFPHISLCGHLPTCTGPGWAEVGKQALSKDTLDQAPCLTVRETLEEECLTLQFRPGTPSEEDSEAALRPGTGVCSPEAVGGTRPRELRCDSIIVRGTKASSVFCG